jgi:phenylacetate-CoA ligase
MKDLLGRPLQYVLSHSSFYQKKFGTDTFGENLLQGFSQLPFTTKQELLDDQKALPPYGSNLCVHAQKIQRIHRTSGTTNTPLIVALTANDIQNTVNIGSQCFALSGLTGHDTVVHCLSYNMWMGGYTDHQSLEATGAAVIPFGVGNTSNLIETILIIKPTAIHCTPSYLAKLELVMKDEFHLKPSDLGLKLGLFGAEPGLQNNDFRQAIEDKWHITAMNANYGMADVLSMFGAECPQRTGLHFMGNDVLYPELIDQTNAMPLFIKEGAVGELVLTNLTREAQPVVRYKTNDIVKILSVGKCACGHDGFRFEIVGRSDDMVTVKGVNVFLSAIERIIYEKINIFTGVYQAHINKQTPVDRVLLKIEKRKDAPACDAMALINDLVTTCRVRLHFKPDIDLVEEGDLPRTQGKAVQIFRTS